MCFIMELGVSVDEIFVFLYVLMTLMDTQYSWEHQGLHLRLNRFKNPNAFSEITSYQRATLKSGYQGATLVWLI